jgi:CrcB protein
MLLMTGLCGGFTTFSAFTLEGIQMVMQGRLMPFLIYMMLSVAVGLLATFAGYKLLT